MKLIVFLIIVLSLYLIYRLSFPKQAEKQEKTDAPPLSDGNEAVLKRRFVLPDRSNPAQRDDRKEDSDKQAEKAVIFAPENENPDAGIIPPEALGEIFGEDVNPDDLDIDETDEDGEETPEDEDEDAELNGNVAYADGCTIDEMTEAVKQADKPESEQSPEAVKTLHRLSKTDMFEQPVSGDAGKAARIASILDRSEQSLAGQNEDAADDGEYRDFDVEQFLS
jgi:cytoskeletal protein RodZ